MFKRRRYFILKSLFLFSKVAYVAILSMSVVSGAFAGGRSPELRYGMYLSEIELKKAVYSSWINTYQKTGCGFDQWNWWGDSNSISGIPNTNQACGSGHISGTWYITKVCHKGYVPDDLESPTICLLPEDVADLSKETGSPNGQQSCTANETEGKAAGNPINFAIGNKFQEEIDFISVGPSPLRFVRYYNSLDGIWRHNYSTHLRIASDNIILVESDGRELYFSLSGGLATAESEVRGTLSKNNGQWVYTSPDNEQFMFDAEGRLIHWVHASGEVQTVIYDNNLKVHVSDGLGNNMVFSNKVIAAANGGLQPLSLAVGDVSISYSYDANNRLAQRAIVRSGQAEVRKFHYEDARNNTLLTGITDERGIRYATWAYDDQGRAISSEHADGAEKVLIAYNADGSSTVTNELGKKTTYRFQTIEGVKRITSVEGEPSVNCPNSNSTFTYDSRGLLKTKTDNKGHLTTYDYNERGLEVSRTEAAGTPQARTVTTDWHPTLFLPVTVTEPSRITHYTYDDQGRQLSQSVTQR